MPFPGPHMLTVFGGPLFTNEQWSCSFRSTPDFGDTTGNDPGVVADVAEAIRAWWAGQSVTEPTAKLGFVKHNRIGEDGKYVNPTTGEVFFLPVVSPTGSQITKPPQIALCATLETGVTRGLAHRGRFFLPVPAANPDALGRISEAVAGQAATTVATLLTTLNGLTNFGTVSVYSRGTMVGTDFPNPGATRPVTGVSVGRVLDTIRTRRAQLEEERPPASPVGGQ